MSPFKKVPSLFVKFLSRRNFIKVSSIGITSLFYKCADVPVKPEVVVEPDPEPITELTAKITGTASIRLPLDNKLEVSFYASNSEPKNIITDYLWARRDIPSLEFNEIGSGETIKDTLDAIGKYEYKLTVKNSNEGTSSEVTHTLEVTPPLLAVIQGPTTEQLISGGVTIQLSGTDSIGEISDYVWSKKTEIDKYVEVGNQQNFSETISVLGINSYKLTVKDSFGVSSVVHDLNIYSNSSIENSIIFFKVSAMGSGATILSKMDPTNFEITELYRDDFHRLSSRSLSKDPNGSKLVLGRYKQGQGGQNLNIYDVSSGKLEQVQSSAGISWKAEWNPKKNWIAYVEDGRYPNRDRDEITLVNTVTKEVVFLAGSQTDPSDKYVSLSLAWDPTGEKLLAGNNRYYIPGIESPVHRLSIFTDWLNSEPVREPLHSEDYLSTYFGSANAKDIHEGLHSVAWSPDNTLIAYDLNGGPYGRISENYYDISGGVLAIAAADGSGIKTVLPDIFVRDINWSPDSQNIIFGKINVGGSLSKICMVDRNGDNFRNISDEIGKSNENFRHPIWT